MIELETTARIRQLYYAEHWKIGTIAQELGLHPDTVRRALETNRFNHAAVMRRCGTDPYVEFVREVLEKHPRLRATRIYQMAAGRGYTGSVVQLRRLVARLRPARREAFLKLETFPGEQGQVDWAYFGKVTICRALRWLFCFLIVLAYSRWMYLEFFFDQMMENFLRGHVRAFRDFSGCPRILLYDYVPGNIIVLLCPIRLCGQK